MNNTYTEEKIKNTHKNTYKILEDFFKFKNLVFYKREEKNSIIFLLPYRFSANGEKFVVEINISVSRESALCRIGFTETLNMDVDFGKELLDMNSELIEGKLSVVSDSDQVSFNTIFYVFDKTDIENMYNKYLYNCLLTYYKLCQKNIIERCDTPTDHEE